MCCCIRKTQLQLLGTACMLIASKLRQPRPLLAETLVYYTDHSVTKEQLLVSDSISFNLICGTCFINTSIKLMSTSS